MCIEIRIKTRKGLLGNRPVGLGLGLGLGFLLNPILLKKNMVCFGNNKIFHNEQRILI